MPILEQESGLKWKEDFHVGYSPERINDNMGRFVVEKTVKMMINSNQNIKNARVGVLGLTL